MYRRSRAIAIPAKRDWRYWATAILAGLFGAGCATDTPQVTRIETPAPAKALNVNLTESPADYSSIPATGNLEVVALFEAGPMPTGVAVSEGGRIFVCFPRWGDPVEFTVGEIVDGQIKPYPSLEYNKRQTEFPGTTLVSVQSVVVDATGKRLWLLDTGSINFQPREKHGAKLIGIDLDTNRVVKEIVFEESVALRTSYLNDVRIDLTRGRQGTAYITDSSGAGNNAILVVDLATGNTMRRLDRHPSTLANEQFVPRVEGKPLMARVPGQPEAYVTIGADGIAISPDGETLYYCALASREWYAVSTDVLADPKASAAQVSAAVREMPVRDFASDGLETDAWGRVYLTDYENNAIRRYTPGSPVFEVIASSPRLIWPDTLAVAGDGGGTGYVYVIANQLNRQPNYQNGKDQRDRPFVLFRQAINAGPIRVQ
ncbi:MAG TPA: L-dopachrome tautomerase-related protein [Tepidisphaeraceae bacterium]|jgi:sugar lactone lactonase YvrE|nr:L-dopachrome tautomerase-related protein [Tepidisphaeraceae bacterium]